MNIAEKIKANLAMSVTVPGWANAAYALAHDTSNPQIKQGFGLNMLLLDDSFLRRVAALQEEHKLVPDGILGPKTVAKMRKIGPFQRLFDLPIAPYQDASLSSCGYPMRTDEILNAEVCFGPNRQLNKDMSFYRYPASYSLRKKHYPDCIVLHWDACRSSKQCYDVLVNRGLSVHFTIDADGKIRQHLDLSHCAYHAGSMAVNQRSIGIEVNNPVAFDRGGQKERYKRPVVSEPKANDAGNEIMHLGFYPEQVESVVKLCNVLCDRFGIPKRLPFGVDETVYSGVSPLYNKALAVGFKGVMGHYHVKRDKMDPGGQLWGPLIDAGFDRGL